MTPPTYEVPTSAKGIRPLLLDSTIPDITLKDSDGADFNLNQAIQKQPTIVLFFLGGW